MQPGAQGRPSVSLPFPAAPPTFPFAHLARPALLVLHLGFAASAGARAVEQQTEFGEEDLVGVPL